MPDQTPEGSGSFA